MARIFTESRPEVVFHLAAQIDVRYSVANPVGDAESNVLGTIAVLEAAREVQSRRVVFSSTGGGLYGDADVFPTPEDSPIRPMAPYGQGKLAAEGYCGLYTRLHGLSTVSLRYGNVYGPRQDVHGEAGVVAIFCGRLVDGKPPIVFGDGTQTRDWVEVSDVVRANLLAAESDVVGSDQHRPRSGDLGARPARGARRSDRRGDARAGVRPGATGRGAKELSRRDPRQARARLGGDGSSCGTGCGGSWPGSDRPPRGLRQKREA